MLKKLESLLVENWKSAHKWLSVWITAGLIALSTADQYMPAIQQYLPAGWVKYFGIAIIVARLIRQSKKAVDDAQ